MARCKCQICKKQLDTSEAYKVLDKNNKNKYYCSESEYIEWQAAKDKEKADKKKVFDLITKIFGYPVVNTILYKEWQFWNVLRSNEIISAYLADKENYLTQTMARLDSNEYAKIKYFSAILKNDLKDYKVKEEIIEKPMIVVDQTMYESPTRVINRRRSLADLEDEV